MANVIVAFSRPEDARNIKNSLTKNGFPVNAVCSSGAQALALTEDLGSGIIVCGYRLTDMIYSELAEDLSQDFTMLLIASRNRLPSDTSDNIIPLPMPLKVHDFFYCLVLIVDIQFSIRRQRRGKPKVRSPEEQEAVDRAKKILMDRNGMTEEEAHRYIQKCSMDSGTNMVETAQMLISMVDI